MVFNPLLIQHSYGKSPFSTGKLAISMAISIAMLNYKRVLCMKTRITLEIMVTMVIIVHAAPCPSNVLYNYIDE